MKRYVAVLPVLVALALPAAASASPYNRDCGTSRGGWLVGSEDSDNETPWMVNGPWHIRMTNWPAQARSLVQRFPVQEFNTKFPLADVPCAIAQGVASGASGKWANWPGNNGWVNVNVGTSGGDASIGLFHCTGYDLQAPDVARETCTTRYRGGAVIASFTISNNPYYP